MILTKIMEETMGVTTWNYADRGNRAKGVTIGTLQLYFSYETCIAFRDGGETIIRENSWSATTGGHLNSIDGGGKEAKKERLPSGLFQQKLDEVLQQHGLA